MPIGIRILVSVLVWFSPFRCEPESIRSSEQQLYLYTGLRRCDKVPFLGAKLIHYRILSRVDQFPLSMQQSRVVISLDRLAKRVGVGFPVNTGVESAAVV